jgi:hypothetical protein
MDRNRVVEAFFDYKPAESHICRKRICRYVPLQDVHADKHHADRVYVDSCEAEYVFHDLGIANLSRCDRCDSGGCELLELSNHGYADRPLIDTLNLILRYLRDVLGVDHGVSFHIKYKYGHPDFAYIKYNGRTYFAGFAGSVKIFFKRGDRRPAAVVLNNSEEIYFFKDHPELRSTYKLYRRLKKLYSEIMPIYNEIRGFLESETYRKMPEVFLDMFRRMYGEDPSILADMHRIWHSLNDIEGKGFYHSFVYARHVDSGNAESLKNLLEREVAFMERVMDKYRRFLAMTRLVR